MVRLGTNLLDIERCPQCGIANPNLVYKVQVDYPIVSSTVRPIWVIYQCSACNDIVAGLAKYEGRHLSQHPAQTLNNNPKAAERIIPNPRSVDTDLPPRARRYLEQALNSLSAPDGAIMLAGSAVDAMLKDVGYEEGAVYSRINKAVEDHVLTAAMSEWAHAVRIESNKPRHADLNDPHATKEMAEQSIKFAEALGEYLFALPARIKRGKEASEKAEEEALNTGAA